MSNAISWLGRYGVFLAILAVSLLLSGCKKELYDSLTEQNANEMVAALLGAGIDASKSPSPDGKAWVLDVEESQFTRAMSILGERGLPQTQFDNLGDLFKKDGLISTPSEERVRFIYGTSQELANTLSKIDGVLVARVQIVLPNNDPLAQTIKPSSAAVFIKYRPGTDIHAWVPQIKTLVMHSVEGLTYDEVSIIAIPANPVDPSTLSPTRAGRDVWLRRIVELLLVVGSIVLFLIAQRGLSFNLKLAINNHTRPEEATTAEPDVVGIDATTKKSTFSALNSLVERIRKLRPRKQ
jgi:type III secretion protein J